MTLVYVLDDDPTELTLWQFAGQDSNGDVQVHTFLTPMDFRIACLQRQPDVAIIDAIMPVETGYDVCKWIRSCCPNVKMVINTAMEAEHYQVMAEMLGACYLQKGGLNADKLEALKSCQSTLNS